MTIELKLATFADHIGEIFEMSREGFPTLTLKLREANDLRRPDRKIPQHVRQDPFQLTFLGPSEPMLPQGPYTLTHETLGSSELFIIPGGPEGEHYLYNITIN